MSIPVIAFFNNKGGVGKTTLVYHTAWMYADLGLKVLAADLDPQANLTSAFVEEERLEQLWPEEGARLSISGCLEPLVRGTSNVGEVHVEEVEESGSKVWIVPGDLLLSSFEAHLSEAWPRCVDGDERAFRATSSIFRAFQRAAGRCQAELVLMDPGPNLGPSTAPVWCPAIPWSFRWLRICSRFRGQGTWVRRWPSGGSNGPGGWSRSPPGWTYHFLKARYGRPDT